MSKTLFTILFLCSLPISVFATDTFTVEDYGQLPQVRSLSISPDGKHYGYIYQQEDDVLFVIRDTENLNVIGGANAGETKARSIYFATNQHVILKTSKTTSLVGYRGKWEHSGSIIYNIKTKKMKTLGRGTKGLYPAQEGLGRIVGINKDTVYMPAFMKNPSTGIPPNHLLRVKLKHGRGKVHAKGSDSTIDWFVGENGNVLAREDYREKSKEHSIYSKITGQWKKIYSLKTDIPEIGVNAISDDEKHLYFTDGDATSEAIYAMSLVDGNISGPLFGKEDNDIDRMLTDELNRKFFGIQYSGLISTYEFSDEQEGMDLYDIANHFPSSNIYPVSASQDRNKLVYLVTGNEGASDYVLYNKNERSLQTLASGYPQVSDDLIAPIKAIKYKARDGLVITSILTWPHQGTIKENLPLIVLPHGGPQQYDKVEFDWWAQYFARKGYLVMQPNFRGSSGFGYAFTKAGHGKWGQEMQHDISDGVKTLISAGYINPKKVCIMGASYGGYAALAGGAFTPELYRCVVSVAGVSDLPLMLATEKKNHGKRHWVVSYWHKLIGDSKTEREKLKDISPKNFADQFQAPVLLIHGKDDTVVPLKQSLRMETALKKADKEVELIVLKGEDHWLSKSETRVQMLRAIDEFLERHNPI